jgi:hypothetical protein
MGALAMDNARKIRTMLCSWSGEATLYRTCVAGPSGQRADIAVGHVRYAWERTGWEFEVFPPRSWEIVGRMTRSTSSRHMGEWIVHAYSDEFPEYEFNHLVGWTDCVSLGVDILVNGVHAATANHDHARISRGKWVPYVPVD